jgi:hypothetical protein
LFGIVQSIGLAFEGAVWMLTGLVAFAAYKLIAALGFRAATLSHDATADAVASARVPTRQAQ